MTLTRLCRLSSDSATPSSSWSAHRSLKCRIRPLPPPSPFSTCSSSISSSPTWRTRGRCCAVRPSSSQASSCTRNHESTTTASTTIVSKTRSQECRIARSARNRRKNFRSVSSQWSASCSEPSTSSWTWRRTFRVFRTRESSPTASMRSRVGIAPPSNWRRWRRPSATTASLLVSTCFIPSRRSP